VRISNANHERNVIQLEAGTYSLTTVDNVGPTPFGGNAFPVIVGDVTIQGRGADATVIERANYLTPTATEFRFFFVAQAGSLTIDGLTLRGARVPFIATAGTILSQGAVTLRESVVTATYAGVAGAIQIAEGALSISDSKIVRTGVDIGGDLIAIGNTLGVPGSTGNASAKVVRTTVADNALGDGGAIAVHSLASATIADCAIVRNSGNAIGAGVLADGSVTILNTTIAQNFGVDVSGVSAIDPNSLVSIVDSTIVDNGYGVDGTVRLQNSIVAGNEQGDCGASTVSYGHNLIGNPRQCALSPNDVAGDPHLGPSTDSGRPGGEYLPLLPGSPAIDAGDDEVCGRRDQTGLARHVDGNGDGIRQCDIGAVEFYPIVNDLVHVTIVQSPHQRDVDSSERGWSDDPDRGEGRRVVRPSSASVTAIVSNTSGQEICNLAFAIVTLAGSDGEKPVIISGDDVLGGAGARIRATLLGGTRNLRAHGKDSYTFTIDLPRGSPITLEANVLGDATGGSCRSEP
jgi:hypothetical protein